jgi:CRISPR system Cascade subunit CasD
MDCLIVRLDAPLMSFGGVVVDQHHPVERFPGVSMLAGLLANALGWHHSDTLRIQALQSSVRFAARWDREPELLIDYQTVDLGQEHLVDTGWTTRGRREERGSGAATSGTHIRLRHYWANGCATIALTVAGVASLDALERALREPARPLVIGRKSCLPAEPLCRGRRTAPTLREALAREPLETQRAPRKVSACWPVEDSIDGGEEIEVHDTRDWPNQMHVGGRRQVHGMLEVTA